MNKNALVWIIILVVVGFGIWYASSSNTGQNNPVSQEAATTTTNVTTTTATGSSGTNKVVTNPNTFHSIFEQSGTHQCTYEQVGGTSEKASSVIDIADGKMRGEFRTTDTSGNTKATLMIYSGGTLYSWQEGMTTGTKSTIKTVADLPQVIPADLTSASVLGGSSQNVGWDCHAWLKDPSVFVVPSYVKFY